MLVRRDMSYLTYAGPQQCLLDVCGRLVVATQKTHPRLRGCSLSSGVKVGKYRQDIRLRRDIGRVRQRSNEKEMVAEGIVYGFRGDTLFNSDFLRGWVVSNADINEARLEILDAIRGIARVPCDPERVCAVLRGVANESIGQF